VANGAKRCPQRRPVRYYRPIRPACLSNLPPCSDPRIFAIKQEARRAAAGLVINDSAGPADGGFFWTTVRGMRSDGTMCDPDQCAGDAGQRVVVHVAYRLPLIVPVLQSALPSIRLVGQVEMYNENYDQYTNTPVDTAPEIPIAPPPGGYDPQADLDIIKTAIPADVVATGDPIAYRLRVTNEGPNDARGLTVVDTLPAGVTIGNVVYPPFITCEAAGNIITCSATEDIPWGYSFDIDIDSIRAIFCRCDY
jgi:uncharacterized repeat protein (TIGR01451 family)